MPHDAEAAAPVLVAFEGPARQRRLTVFFRLLLAIPQLVVLIFVGVAALVVEVLGWFGALFMGRLPRFAAEFLPGYLRWSTRVIAYLLLLTDRYPPFAFGPDDSYPVEVTAQPGRLNRWAVLFRIILIIPAALVGTVVQYGAMSIMGFIAWLIVLFSGRMPPSWYWAYAAVIRYQARVNGYASMITSQWPWGLFGDRDTAAAPGPPSPFGAPPSYPPTYGAPPSYPPTYGAPPPAAPAWSAPSPPVVPGVTFTFGGPSYLWGYTYDRSLVGIWSATDLGRPPQMWPIGEQGEAWTRFWELEPHAVELSEAPLPSAAPVGAQYAVASTDMPVDPYAAPWPYATSGSPPRDSRWRLVLSPTSKGLMVLFIVFGVMVFGVMQVVQFSHNNFFQTIVARVQVQTAYDSLDSTYVTWQPATRSCLNAPQPSAACLDRGARVVSQAFGTFVRTLGGVSEPPKAVAAAAQLESDSSRVEQILSELAGSTSVSQYEQSYQSLGVPQALRRFSLDYQHLVSQLH